VKTLKLCASILPRCNVCTALAIIALLSVSHITFAQQVDSKVYPGASCQSARFGGPSAGPRFLYDELGRLVNLDTVDLLEVICPVVRDETTGTAGIKHAFVRVVKATPADARGNVDFVCQLFSRTHLGDLVDMGTAIGRGLPGTRILSIRPDPIQSSDGLFPGYYYIRCLIPRALGEEEDVGLSDDIQSAIISYRVDEIRSSQPEVPGPPDEDAQ